MIGSLRGPLLERTTDGTVIIEAGGAGVGYRVVTGVPTAFELGDIGEEVFVWVHHHIRDDAQCLYGFVDPLARTTFEALLGAHGVGPALALAILGVHTPAELARIVADDDTAGLCLVPGVGKKTAARLLIELKSRLAIPDLGSPAPGGVVGPDNAGGSLADVQAALEGLGYRPEETVDVLRSPEVRAAPDTETALRIALRQLAGHR
ncbi:MAG: Holliday junction branch migration protein RuvA [Actinobacteria bacterium]|nr:Holliday junction branch migration protein RuvA [Actinomycetota bacterium]